MTKKTVKTRKPSYRSLELRIKHQVQMLCMERESNALLRLEVRALEKKLTEKIDTSLMDARIKLASNIGQLTEAVSKAITMIVGKEVM